MCDLSRRPLVVVVLWVMHPLTRNWFRTRVLLLCSPLVVLRDARVSILIGLLVGTRVSV